MARSFIPMVVSAKARATGEVVYMTCEGTWAADPSSAEVLTDEADAQLRLLDAEAQAGTVVGVALAEIAPVAPARQRTAKGGSLTL